MWSGSQLDSNGNRVGGKKVGHFKRSHYLVNQIEKLKGKSLSFVIERFTPQKKGVIKLFDLRMNRYEYSQGTVAIIDVPNKFRSNKSIFQKTSVPHRLKFKKNINDQWLKEYGFTALVSLYNKSQQVYLRVEVEVDHLTPYVKSIFDEQGNQIYPFTEFKLYRGGRLNGNEYVAGQYLESFLNGRELTKGVRAIGIEGESYFVTKYRIRESGIFSQFGVQINLFERYTNGGVEEETIPLKFRRDTNVFKIRRGGNLGFKKDIDVAWLRQHDYEELIPQYEKSFQREYLTLKVVFENGEPVLQDVYDEWGQKLYPFSRYQIYTDAHIKDGKIVGGSSLGGCYSPYGCTLKLKKNKSGSQRFVVSRFRLRPEGLFHSWGYYVEKPEYSQGTVAKNRVPERYWDNDDIFIKQKSNRLKFKEHINEEWIQKRGFFDLIAPLKLAQRIDVMVQVLVKGGKIILESIFDEEGNQLYPLKEFCLYKNDIHVKNFGSSRSLSKKIVAIAQEGDSFEIKKYRLTEIGRFSSFDLHKEYSNYIKGTISEEKIPDEYRNNEDIFIRKRGGRLKFKDSIDEKWLIENGFDDLIESYEYSQNVYVSLSVIIENGMPKVQEIYDDQGVKLYPIEEFVLYSGGKVKNGKVLNGKRIQGFLDPSDLSKKITALSKKGTTFIVDKFRVPSFGRIQLLNLSKTMYEYEQGTIPEGQVPEELRNTPLFIKRPRRRLQFKEHVTKEWLIANKYSVLIDLFESSQKIYITLVIKEDKEGPKVVAIYDDYGHQIYPYKKFTLYTAGQIIKGKRSKSIKVDTFVGVASLSKALKNLAKKYDSFIVEGFNPAQSGRFSFLDTSFIRSSYSAGTLPKEKVSEDLRNNEKIFVDKGERLKFQKNVNEKVLEEWDYEDLIPLYQDAQTILFRVEVVVVKDVPMVAFVYDETGKAIYKSKKPKVLAELKTQTNRQEKLVRSLLRYWTFDEYEVAILLPYLLEKEKPEKIAELIKTTVQVVKDIIDNYEKVLRPQDHALIKVLMSKKERIIKKEAGKKLLFELFEKGVDEIDEIVTNEALSKIHQVQFILYEEKAFMADGTPLVFPPSRPKGMFERMMVRNLWDRDRGEMVFDVAFQSWKTDIVTVRYALIYSNNNVPSFLEVDRTYHISESKMHAAIMLHRIMFWLLSQDGLRLYSKSSIKQVSHRVFGNWHEELSEFDDSLVGNVLMELDERLEKVYSRLSNEDKPAFRLKAVLILANNEIKRRAADFIKHYLYGVAINPLDQLREERGSLKFESMKYQAYILVEEFLHLMVQFMNLLIQHDEEEKDIIENILLSRIKNITGKDSVTELGLQPLMFIFKNLLADSKGSFTNLIRKQRRTFTKLNTRLVAVSL